MEGVWVVRLIVLIGTRPICVVVAVVIVSVVVVIRSISKIRNLSAVNCCSEAPKIECLPECVVLDSRPKELAHNHVSGP